MSMWLDTSGKTSLQIVICDRCKRKVSVMDVVSDPNSPGLWVCGPMPNDRKGGYSESCVDVLDPYRLPPRETEDISPMHPRPDLNIAAPAVVIGTPAWPFPDPDQNEGLV